MNIMGSYEHNFPTRTHFKVIFHGCSSWHAVSHHWVFEISADLTGLSQCSTSLPMPVQSERLVLFKRRIRLLFEILQWIWIWLYACLSRLTNLVENSLKLGEQIHAINLKVTSTAVQVHGFAQQIISSLSKTKTRSPTFTALKNFQLF